MYHGCGAFDFGAGPVSDRDIVPLVLAVVYGFLTIRLEEVSILDFLTYAVAFFLTQQQYYEWRLDDAA